MGNFRFGAATAAQLSPLRLNLKKRPVKRENILDRYPIIRFLIIDDFGMRKPPHTAAEDLLEIVMR
jgi:hypothetical protein